MYSAFIINLFKSRYDDEIPGTLHRALAVNGYNKKQ
jgi:hypothetical protein